MAVVRGGFRQPGEIDSSSGEGNAEFNSGRVAANFAYRLTEVYQLNNPVPLEMMKKSGWVDGPPQRYTYVPPAVVGALLANLRCRLLVSVQGRTVGDGLSPDETAEEALSISQEIETQLLCGLPDGQMLHRQRPPIPRTAHENPDERYNCGGARLTRSSSGAVSKPFTQGEVHGTNSEGWAATAGRTGIPWGGTVVSQAPPDSCISHGTPVSADGDSGTGLNSNMHQQDVAMSSRKTAPQHCLFQASLSADSTQIVMPDSLYEEVRQAPPAVILDSEGEEDEED
ncbi:hypothetical protein CMQ_3891 [Grosmannia clavigera kw1407]|uniref:Uncharacterized protein n=1 Tax=Grosmannia clavigera (strain kw1407 / UAMH 11150) TaxID=655863 RepID=F0X996_GROCL|nr:uncharacterized protein CMQ_3891 [Grosmannia clavigera kw1407]EFX05822.1 hypothetical protein CMQ_3891 [Grosmannia clavigera kw1407]